MSLPSREPLNVICEGKNELGQNDVTIVRTDFDLVTNILANKIAPEVIVYAHKRLYSIVDLYKERANKTELLGNFIYKVPATVWLFSHGTEDEVIGPDVGSTVADLGNTVWFNGKMVSIVACLTGRKLATAMVHAGARAVFAYNDTLEMRVWPETYEPLMGFKECITKPKLMFDGLKASEVYKATVEEYEKWIAYWDERDPITADVLRHDRDAFALYGTGESKITASAYILIGLTDIFAVTWIFSFFLLQVLRLTKPLWRK